MLTFRGPEAEAILSADNYARLVEALRLDLVDRFTAADRAAYLEAWSQPGALTGGLNWYRAAGVGPPAGDGGPARSLGGGVHQAAGRVAPPVVSGESAH